MKSQIIVGTRSNYNANYLAFVHAYYTEHFLSERDYGIPERVKANSYEYINYLTEKSFCDQAVTRGTGAYDSLYVYLKRSRNGLIRDRLVTNLLVGRAQMINSNIDSLAFDTLGYLKDKQCRSLVNQLTNRGLGKPAFDFSLPDEKGAYHTLRDFRGKVVLVDFWYAACKPCHLYDSEVLHPIGEEFYDSDSVQFVMVSIDDEATWRNAMASRPHARNRTDLFTEGLRSRHPMIEHYRITAYPFPILIDANGHILGTGRALRDLETLRDAITTALGQP